MLNGYARDAADSAATQRQSRIGFMIRGWSVRDDRAGANQVWITVSTSWRTAWR